MSTISKEVRPLVSWNELSSLSPMEGAQSPTFWGATLAACERGKLVLASEIATPTSALDVQLHRGTYPEGYDVFRMFDPKTGQPCSQPGIAWSRTRLPHEQPLPPVLLGDNLRLHDVAVWNRGTQTTIESVPPVGLPPHTRARTGGRAYITPETGRFYLSARGVPAEYPDYNVEMVIEEQAGRQRAELTIRQGADHEMICADPEAQGGSLTFGFDDGGRLTSVRAQNQNVLRLIGVEPSEVREGVPAVSSTRAYEAAGKIFDFPAGELDLHTSAVNIYRCMGLIAFNPLTALAAK